MTTLRDMPRYIRNTDAFGWQGADDPNGPWRSIAPPQSGAPWSALDFITTPPKPLRGSSNLGVTTQEPSPLFRPDEASHGWAIHSSRRLLLMKNLLSCISTRYAPPSYCTRLPCLKNNQNSRHYGDKEVKQ